MNAWRVFFAFLIAPAVPLFYFLAAMYFGGGDIVGVALIYALVFGYVPALVFGVPVFLWLRNAGRLSFLSVLVAGVVVGVAVLYVAKLVLVIMLDSPLDLASEVGTLIWGGGFGLIVAASFNLIAGIPFRAGGE